MKKTLKVLLVTALSIILVVSLIGCSTGANDKLPVDENPPAGDSPQNGSDDPVGGDNGNEPSDDPKDYNGVTAKVLTQGYPAEIERYLEENKLKETQQAFNIDNRTYLVLTMGEQNSAGFAINLKDLVLEDGILKVFVKYVIPGKDAIVATVMTYPSLVIETDKIYEGHYEIAYDIE